MQPYKILIADDELLGRQAIKLALPDDNSVSVVAECMDGTDAISKIRKYQPDIIFLDIQMPGKTGIEVLESLPVNYHPYMIVVSAYDNYALAAYEHDASDYLLKPFSQKRFDKVFGKALKYLTSTMQPANRDVYKQTINIKNGGKVTVVPCADVVFIEADGDYTLVHTHARKYIHTETLSSLENTLDPDLFRRIHRSYIVNIKGVKELRSHHNGDYTVVLQDDRLLKLSRNYKKHLQQLIR